MNINYVRAPLKNLFLRLLPQSKKIHPLLHVVLNLVLIPLQVITLVETDNNQTAIMIPTCTLDRKGGRCGDLI